MEPATPEQKFIHSELASLREVLTVRFNALDRENLLRAEAVKTANTEMNRRLEGMNEFRSELQRNALTYLTRSEYNFHHADLEKRLEDFADTSDKRFRSIERLVYVGMGAAFVINTAIIYFLRLH
jgi:glucose-6-phosphate isomerase